MFVSCLRLTIFSCTCLFPGLAMLTQPRAMSHRGNAWVDMRDQWWFELSVLRNRDIQGSRKQLLIKQEPWELDLWYDWLRSSCFISPNDLQRAIVQCILAAVCMPVSEVHKADQIHFWLLWIPLYMWCSLIQWMYMLCYSFLCKQGHLDFKSGTAVVIPLAFIRTTLNKRKRKKIHKEASMHCEWSVV